MDGEPDLTDDDQPCYATGGLIKSDKVVPLLGGCNDSGYIIPKAFAERWGRELLDRLNEDVLD